MPDSSASLMHAPRALRLIRNARAIPAPVAGPLQRPTRPETGIDELRAELERVKALLHEDPDTGVLSRRGLAAAFEREAARAERCGSALSLIVFETDDLGKLRTRYGANADGQISAHVAAIALRALRPTDALACHGRGYAAMLPEVYLDQARLCTLRLQAALAAAPLAHDKQRIPLTLTAGVIECAAGEPLHKCLARGDDAFAAARRGGKNRIKTLA